MSMNEDRKNVEEHERDENSKLSDTVETCRPVCTTEHRAISEHEKYRHFLHIAAKCHMYN